MNHISPLAPKRPQTLPALDGVNLAVGRTMTKYRDRDDLLVISFDAPAVVAGVFTQSKCPSAAVDWCRQILPKGKASALMVNAGNANAFTGKLGEEAVRLSAELVARHTNCPVDEIYLASTGVIGEPLDATKFSPALGSLVRTPQTEAWLEAASAIMTTDTFPKLASRTVTVAGNKITLNGIAKGSGMIAPDMATMLAFVVTDASIAQPILQQILAQAVHSSFNAITVDGDTSTSDTVLLFATGRAKTQPITDLKDAHIKPVVEALNALCLEMAQQIVRDGEGARKFVCVNVIGAESAPAAKKIAQSIANSPLVKTAIAGEDPNWGRVVMAVGKAGELADRDRLTIWFGDVRVAVNGVRDPSYDEEVACAVMRRDEIDVSVDLGIGSGEATVWTCDLTKDYVAINGDYRS